MRITARSPERERGRPRRSAASLDTPLVAAGGSPSEVVRPVDADRARRVREVGVARPAAALVVERETRGLVPDVVDVERPLPAIAPHARPDIAERVAGQLGVDRVCRAGPRRYIGHKRGRKGRCPGRIDYAEVRLLATE